MLIKLFIRYEFKGDYTSPFNIFNIEKEENKKLSFF